MWLLFGFFGGIGMGLAYLPSILIVGYCFKEKRAIATGKIFEQLSGSIVAHFDRHCDGGHWRWFHYVWTAVTIPIQCIRLENGPADIGCNSTRMRLLLSSNGSYQNHYTRS